MAMINRIKRAIAEYHDSREWFLQILKNGDWERYESWLNMVQHRIRLDDILIDITELGSGRYRVAASPRARYDNWGFDWKAVEFAETSRVDIGWVCKVHDVLDKVYSTKTVVK